MSDFGTYLSRVREHLDVSARRAEEIVAETYSHLEEHARQLMESGLSREAAVREAERAMGDPAALAAQITQANGRHRAPSVLRGLTGMGVIFAAAFSLVPIVALAAEWAERHQALGGGWSLPILAGALIPAALLAGLVSGRRYWWAAFTPVVVYVLLIWGDSLLEGRLLFVTLRMQFLHAVVHPALVALVLGPVSYAGSRMGATPSVRRLIGAAASAPYLLFTAAAVIRGLNGVQGTFTGMVIAEGAAILLLLAVYAERRISRRQLLTWLLLACGLSALAMGATAAVVPLDPGTSGTVYGALIAMVGTVALAAVVGALKVREATQSRPSAH